MAEQTRERGFPLNKFFFVPVIPGESINIQEPNRIVFDAYLLGS